MEEFDDIEFGGYYATLQILRNSVVVQRCMANKS